MRNGLRIRMSLVADDEYLQLIRFDKGVLTNLEPRFRNWMIAGINDAATEMGLSSPKIVVHATRMRASAENASGQMLALSVGGPQTVAEHSGPSASALLEGFNQIVELYKMGTEAFSHASFGWFLISAVSKAKKRAEDWTDAQKVPTLRLKTTYELGFLSEMCVGHLSHAHGYMAKGDVEPYNTSTMPTGMMPVRPSKTYPLDYVVAIPTDMGTYLFRVLGDSRILSLQLRKNGVLEDVACHDFLDQPVDGGTP